jgi:hypothetical protein
LKADPFFIAPIVEGHGEVAAITVLLQRVARKEFPSRRLEVNPAIRVRVGSFLNDKDYRGKYLELAAAKARAKSGAILVLLDCDGAGGSPSCAAELGARLRDDIEGRALGVPYIVALAVQEYESWFLASVTSLAGEAGLTDDVMPPPDIERLRDAKGWLKERTMPAYDPISDQARFTRLLDLDLAEKNSPSFRRFVARLRQQASAPLSESQ